MNILIRLAVIALGLGFAAPGFSAPAMAQDAACKQAIINLEDVKAGRSPPVGIEPDGLRIKATGDYNAAADEAAFAIDAYREHGDVRGLCPKAKWPATVKSDSLKKALAAAAKANPKTFCGGDPMTEAKAPKIVRGRLNSAGADFFSDRALELQGQLDTTAGVKQQTAARHLQDTEWLLEVIADLDAACPNGGAALDLGSAKISVTRARDFAKENVAFVNCVKARQKWDPQMKAFDAVAAGGDQAAMTASYKALEKAAGPVNAACKASEEGTKENAYLLAARKLRILFLTTPGCRDAALAMNNIRTTMNSASKSSLPGYVTDLRKSAKEAGAACKDPSAEIWGDFVAWITEKNYDRVPDKKQQ